MVIKRIGPLSCAKLSGMLYALLGLVFGAIVSLISLVAGGIAQAAGVSGAGMSSLMGVSAIVVFPILYGVFGFVGTLVGAWLYNVAAGVVGGVEIEIG